MPVSRRRRGSVLAQRIRLPSDPVAEQRPQVVDGTRDSKGALPPPPVQAGPKLAHAVEGHTLLNVSAPPTPPPLTPTRDAAFDVAIVEDRVKGNSNGAVPPEGKSEEVTVCWGEEKFSPKAYHSMSVGPFFAKTQVRPGETQEEAMNRAYDKLVHSAERERDRKFRSLRSALDGD